MVKGTQHIIAKLFVLLSIIAWSHSTVATQNTEVKLALLVTSGEQRTAWVQASETFNNRYPHIAVNIQYLPNEPYHRFMQNWETADVDLVYSFAGRRLQQQILSDQIQPLDHLWIANNWKEQYSGLRPIIGDQYHVYAVPLSYYQWGFYYNKQLFNDFGFTTPRTWDELLLIANKLRTHGLYAFVFPGREGWMASSWFSYLNLRVNGIEFHHDLLDGAISFRAQAVKKVFLYWSEVLTRGYFAPETDRSDIRQSLPFIYRKQAAMMLSGNFITKHTRPEFRTELGYFPFPTINPDIPVYEEAPTDVIFMHRNSKNKKAAELFLSTLATPENLLVFNETVGYISPNKLSGESANPFIREGANVLKSAAGTTQFLDRDSHITFAKPAMKILAKFMKSGDIETAITSLEQLRLKTLGAEVSN